MTSYRSPSRHAKSGSRLKRILAFVLPLIVLAGGVWWFVLRDNQLAPPVPSAPDSNQSTAPEESAYIAPDLQPTIDAWIQKYSASYHIAVYDLQADKLIGSHEPDTGLFAASLYKLFVAYLSYKDFQSGAQHPNEIISQGRTKLQCAEAMIRSSDSPCGEAMMANIGQKTLNQRVADEIGTTSTTFNGIRTSASDSIQVLKLIYAKKFLADEYYNKFMDSMLTQDAKFKRGLQSGAPEATWHTKVGWNEDINYHDVGFMTLPDGRKFAVAILGQGSGSSAPIADFANTIYTALAE